WWQTETGWSIAANCRGLGLVPIKEGSATHPAPGWDLRVLKEDGTEAKAGEIGALAVRLPLPPGAFPTLWNAPQRY
ncbi:MAG TPA: propionyl-CoA synthetase, partial [Gammaproteobacteria bacterium]|nr:propionyl-CoA synthetase [Gammaproteobacteria bacterium]